MTTFNDLYDIRSRSNLSKFAKKMIDAGFGEKVLDIYSPDVIIKHIEITNNQVE